jgi:DNA-3-methyladenine glycosylase I
VLVNDDNTLFEFLILEGAQAGLSWLTILKKRNNYKKAFYNFEPNEVANFSEKQVEYLLKNPGLIRNKLKIAAAINNAKAFLRVQEEFGSFYKYSLQFINGERITNKWIKLEDIPVTTKQSDSFSKDLKQRGFKFVGSTTIYAYMQAVGMVNDHLVSCFRHKLV